MFTKPAKARFHFRACLKVSVLSNRFRGSYTMESRARSLITYVLDRLVNRHPRFRLFLLNTFFADRDVDIELYGSRLRVNTRKDIGYLNAYKRAQLSVVFRHESGVLATLALLLEPTDTFVDIGANIGLFPPSSRVWSTFSQGKVLCFRAQSRYCQTPSRNADGQKRRDFRSSTVRSWGRFGIL